MLIQRALLGLPTLFLIFAPTDAKDVHGPSSQEEEQPRQIIPLAIRKMGLDVGEKFYPEQYYGFESEADSSDSAAGAKYSSKKDSLGRSLASLFSFGRRSPSIATSPDSIHERQDRQDGGRWPVAARRTFPRDEDSLLINTSESTSIARLFPPAYLPPFSIHHEASDDGHENDSSDNAPLELFRRATDALSRLQKRQWGCPTGTSSCESIGYPYSCCSTTETCYKVTDTGLGPVGCCPSGETCGGAVSDCTSDSTACPESLGGGCCIAGYVCEGVGCVKSGASGTTTAAKTSTTTSTTVAATGQASTIVVTVVVTETPGGTLTTRTTTITSIPSTKTTSTSSGGGVAPVKQTLTTTASGLPAGYCPTGYYACLASAGGGCCQTGRDCKTTSCPPAAAMTTIVNTNGITVVVPETAAAAATAASATCASGWFLCGSNAGPVAGCCPSGYSCGTASCSLTGASATTVQKELPTSTGDSGSTSSARRAGAEWGILAVAALPFLLVL
ncbi:hypothetical protein SBRCBS47491_004198 [Sporothrix bragantina]|uniref:GPI anchored protein n=1 Tax=Sporothrix bragantina TaxID=671064 RepID=A0ABP0BLS6_9PEZI